MKKLFVGVMLATFCVSLAAFGSPAINKSHKGKVGKGDAKVNCNYCHKAAGIAKEKTGNAKAAQKGPFCATSGCHG